MCRGSNRPPRPGAPATYRSTLSPLAVAPSADNLIHQLLLRLRQIAVCLLTPDRFSCSPAPASAARRQDGCRCPAPWMGQLQHGLPRLPHHSSRRRILLVEVEHLLLKMSLVSLDLICRMPSLEDRPAPALPTTHHVDMGCSPHRGTPRTSGSRSAGFSWRWQCCCGVPAGDFAMPPRYRSPAGQHPPA